MKHPIMVVDDSKVIYNEMKEMLEETDIEIVYFCRTGEEAIKAYEIVKPELVTMDIIMPGIDGFDAAKMLLKKWPNASILMVSSLAYDDTMQAADSVGAKGFLFKPFVKETLINTIYNVLQEEKS